jgi:hypothetical protein
MPRRTWPTLSPSIEAPIIAREIAAPSFEAQHRLQARNDIGMIVAAAESASFEQRFAGLS